MALVVLDTTGNDGVGRNLLLVSERWDWCVCGGKQRLCPQGLRPVLLVAQTLTSSFSWWRSVCQCTWQGMVGLGEEDGASLLLEVQKFRVQHRMCPWGLGFRTILSAGSSDPSHPFASAECSQSSFPVHWAVFHKLHYSLWLLLHCHWQKFRHHWDDLLYASFKNYKYKEGWSCIF